MAIYEYATIVVGVDALTESLNNSTQDGWEIFQIVPFSYSPVNKPFTDLNQVLVILRSGLDDPA